eukprot:9565524-Lingulodinium_polyedra.AAC.1
MLTRHCKSGVWGVPSAFQARCLNVPRPLQTSLQVVQGLAKRVPRALPRHSRRDAATLPALREVPPHRPPTCSLRATSGVQTFSTRVPSTLDT